MQLYNITARPYFMARQPMASQSNNLRFGIIEDDAVRDQLDSEIKLYFTTELQKLGAKNIVIANPFTSWQDPQMRNWLIDFDPPQASIQALAQSGKNRLHAVYETLKQIPGIKEVDNTIYPGLRELVYPYKGVDHPVGVTWLKRYGMDRDETIRYYISDLGRELKRSYPEDIY